MTDFDQLTSWENLFQAWKCAARGKRGAACVARFEHRLEEELITLQDSLRQGSYRPGSYTSFTVHEPKRRRISAAPFRDRVVHHALCQVTEPRFERSFVIDSFANRVGRGTHRAVDRVQHFVRNHRYALQCDLKQFFPSIDHELLLAVLAAKVTDSDVFNLIRLVVASGAGVLSAEYTMAWFPGDDLLAANRPRGLPIGNLTSQFWANCFLNPFDHFIKRELRCGGYVRYVDDFVLFADTKPQLWAWKEQIRERLARLRLSLHPHAQPRPVKLGVPFLGFTIFPDRRRLKRRKGIHFARRLRWLAAEYHAGRIPLAEVTQRVASWVEHVRHGNTVGLRAAILGAVRFDPPPR